MGKERRSLDRFRTEGKPDFSWKKEKRKKGTKQKCSKNHKQDDDDTVRYFLPVICIGSFLLVLVEEGRRKGGREEGPHMTSKFEYCTRVVVTTPSTLSPGEVKTKSASQPASKPNHPTKRLSAQFPLVAECRSPPPISACQPSSQVKRNDSNRWRSRAEAKDSAYEGQ